MKRPVLWVALPFIAGLFLSAKGLWLPLPWTLAPLGAAFLILLLGRRLPYQGQLALTLLFLCCGALWWEGRTGGTPGDPLYYHHLNQSEAVLTLEGVVRKAPLFTQDTDYAALQVAVDHIHTPTGRVPMTGGVLLRWTNPTHRIHPGQRIQWTGTLSARLGPVNFGVNGYEDYLHTREIYTESRIRSDDLTPLAARSRSPHYWASRLRHWQADVLAQSIPESARPFVYTVWLGETYSIDRDSKSAFLKSGMAHLLAVSGLYCGIIFMVLTLVLSPLIPSPARRSVIILLAVILFALVAGARIPSIRAATMIGLYLSADWFRREPDAPTALGLSAFLFLLHSPLLLFDVGFLLSFGSIASLMLFADGIGDQFTALPYRLQQSLGTVLGVQLVPLPVVATTFHTLPLLAPLLNLIAVPLLFIVLLLTLLTVTTAGISTQAALLFGHALAPVVSLIQGLAELGALVPGGHRIITRPTLPGLFSYGLMLLFLYMALYSPKKRRIFFSSTGLALLLCLVLWRPTPDFVGVDFLDVGHGDAALVRCPDGTTLLIDGGMKSDYIDVGSSVVVPYLCNHGITLLDYVIGTHPDADHLGGLITVVETLEVGTLILGPHPHPDDPDEQALLKACEKQGVSVQRLAKGDTLDIPGVDARVLHPAADHQSTNINDHSLVLRMAWSGISILFTGDIEQRGEYQLSQEDCTAQILKVPHHGSRTSSSTILLDAVQPKVAVASALERGRIVPMRPEIQNRYDNRNIPLWRTDHHGAIRMQMDGDQVTVTSARNQKGWLLAPIPTP